MNNNYKKVIFFVSIFLVLFCIALFVDIQNNFRKQKIYEIRDTLFYLSKLPDNNNFSQKIENIIQKKEQLGEYLVSKDNPLPIIEEIEKKIIDNKLQGEVKRADFVEEDLVLEILAEGSLGNIRNFLSDIENFDKEISIESIKIGKITSDNLDSWGIFLGIISRTK